MKRWGIVCLLIVPGAFAQVVTTTPRGVAVANSGSLQLFDRSGREVLWSGEGVDSPTAVIASSDRIAVIDSINNEARVADLPTGRGRTVHTGETPIDGLFVGGDFFLLARDARSLDRIGSDGAKASVAVAADPAFIRQAGDRIYVYSRTAGVLQEITISPFAVHRSAQVGPFASDLELDSRNAYLAYPRAAKIGVVSLASMTSAGNIDVGAVPVDVAFASRSTALTARTLAVADPSAKRVWMIEGAQSFTQAVTRGFLRGLLGLGLFGGRASQFPTGVDRVIVRGSAWFAFDTSSGTLYRFTKSRSVVLAKGIAPAAFSVGPDGVFIWNDAVRRLQRLE